MHLRYALEMHALEILNMHLKYSITEGHRTQNPTYNSPSPCISNDCSRATRFMHEWFVET